MTEVHDMLKTKWIAAGLVICMAVFGTGCGQPRVPGTVQVTSLAISDKGEVTSYLVEAFDKSYYDISKLTAMAMEEAADYNAEHPREGGHAVVVENVELLNEDAEAILLTQKFDSAATYAEYCGEKLFFGTVTEALAAGYTLPQDLKSVKDGAPLPEDQLMNNADKKLIITDTRAVIYAPKSVSHISNGIYNADGTVDTTGTEGEVILLLK